MKRIAALVAIYDGDTPVVIYIEDEKKQFRLVGALANPKESLINKIEKLVGNSNVVLK